VTAGCPPCTELALAALGERRAGLIEWAVVLSWQRIGRGIVRVVQRVAEGRAWTPSSRQCQQEVATGNPWCLGSGRSGLLLCVPREAV